MKFIVYSTTRATPPHPAAILEVDTVASWYTGDPKEADEDERVRIYTIEIHDMNHLLETVVAGGRPLIIKDRDRSESVSTFESVFYNADPELVRKYKDTPVIEVYDGYRE